MLGLAVVGQPLFLAAFLSDRLGIERRKSRRTTTFRCLPKMIKTSRRLLAIFGQIRGKTPPGRHTTFGHLWQFALFPGSASGLETAW
jgi:hypothetical protein